MTRIFAAALTTAILATPAFASEMSCNSPSQDQWLAKSAVTEMYVGQGYQVKNIKIEDGCYEVYAITDKGVRVELIVDPMTGETLGTENEG